MSDWWSFILWLLEQEPANKIYFGLSLFLFLIIILEILSLVSALVVHVFCLFTGLRTPPKKNGVFTSTVTLILTAISVFPISMLLQSYDHNVKSTYEEAEVYYKNGAYEEAKELYELIYVTNFQKCREQIKLCDLGIAENLAKQNRYFSVFKILYPYLHPDFDGDVSDAPSKMRNMLLFYIDDIARENQAKEMFVDAKWMLGTWLVQDNLAEILRAGTEEDCYYIRFYFDPFGQDSICIDSDFLPSSLVNWENETDYLFRNGILSIKEATSGEYVPIIVFYAATEDTCYMYNRISEAMYMLSKESYLRLYSTRK